MNFSSITDLLLEYSTFGGETNFTTSVGSAVVSLIATVASLQLALLTQGVSGTGLIAVSLIGSILFPVGLFHYTRESGERTTDPRFHSRTGRAKVMAVYFLIGGVSVLLIRVVGVTIMSGIGFFELTLPELVLGIALSLGFALVVSVANYSSLSGSYPSLQDVLTTFQSESTANLDGVANEIDGLGHVTRSETSRVLEAIQENSGLDNVIIRGQGGVGKSGVLKRVTEQCEYEILFIDVSAYPVIRSETDLADEIGLGTSLERGIQQVSANRSLLVVFDQLDDASRESGEIYSDLIDAVSQIDGISTIFACRTYELNNHGEFRSLSKSGHFDTEVEVTSLSEAKVRGYLEDIGVSTPSGDLIELCEEIEYLDVVGRLADDNTDLDHITAQVTVWEEYRNLLAEDHPSDDQRRGNRIIDRAVEHATGATESGNSVFPISDLQWTDEQLISTGAIQNVSGSGRERIFRFRHQQFQLYLYAWNKVNETVDDETLFRQTIQELDDNINYDVVKWMFAALTDSDTDLPADTDAFLDEILDDDGFGFYWASKILDVVKKWDASENQGVTSTVLAKLERRDDLYDYFFDIETDPSWAQALADSGRFHNPPRHLVGYLYQTASQHPETVQRIVRDNVGSLDRRGQAIVVSAIRELPIEYGADLTELVVEWLSNADPAMDSYYSQSIDFTEELIASEYFEEGLKLTDALLTVRLEAANAEDSDDSMGSYYLNSLFEEGTIEQLIESRPTQSINLLETKLQDAAHIRVRNKNRELNELQFFYLHTVSSYRVENDNRNQLFEQFIGFLREAIDAWFKNTDPGSQREKIQEYLCGNVVFRAFGFYLLRTYDEGHQETVAEELLRDENYRDTRLKKEFKLLLKHGFRSLSHGQQVDIVDTITSVPIRDRIEAGAEEESERFENMTVSEIVEQESSRWIRDHLWLIKDDLPDEASNRLKELQSRFEDTPGDPETSAVRGGYVSHESPVPASTLRNKSSSNLIDFCIEEPFEEEEQYNRDSVEERGRKGAAEAIADIILGDPEFYASEIPRLAEAPDSYAIELLGRLRSRMDEEPELLGNTLFRKSLLTLFDTIVSNTDDWPANVRKRVGWLLRDGLGDEDLYKCLLQEEIKVKDLIFQLLDDPDPDIESDRPPEGYAGHNNPSHNALNTVRPVALAVLITYLWRKTDAEDSELGAEMAKKLEKMLDDSSLAVHSVFGRRFVQLWTIDQDWVIAHLSDIFPRSQSRQDVERFTAAWDTYVASNKVYGEIFPELRKYYFHEIDLLADGEATETMNLEEGMATHVLANYLFEYSKEDWQDSLLAYLYDRGTQELARKVAWRLWSWGDRDDIDAFDHWKKTQKLWQKRLDQVGESEEHSDEISWFVRWLEHLEDKIELEEVVDLLRESSVHIANNRRAWLTVEEYLASQSTENTVTAIDLLHSLSMNYDRPIMDGFTEEIESVLRPAFVGFEHGDETYEKAFEIAELLASENDAEAQRFIDEYR